MSFKFKIYLPIFLAMLYVAMFSQKTYAASTCGINIDPQNPSGFPSADSITGVEWVRIEFKDCTRAESLNDPQFGKVIDNYKSAISSYINNGSKVLLILDYVSYPEARTNNTGFAKRAALVAEAFSDFGNNIAYEIWNEPDHPQGGNMTSQEYGLMLKEVVDAMPESATVISAGLAGQDSPTYIKEVAGVMGASWQKVDGVGTHPYGKMPPNLAGLGEGTGPLGEYIDRMYNAGDAKPLWITEIGYNTTEDALQTQYLNAFYNYAETQAKIANVIWYAWHDSSAGSFGLTRTDGSPKSTYTAFFRNACDVDAPNVIRSNPTLPDINVEAGASCTPLTEGSEDRVISGFVRTTRLVRKSVPCSDGSSGCTRTISNQPITGATVTAYTGRSDFGTGFYNGRIENKIKTVITDQRGYFEVPARPGDDGAAFNFLFFRCGTEGKDLWLIDITNNVEGMNFYLDCETYYDTAYEGPDAVDVIPANGVLSCKLPEENYYQTAYTYNHARSGELELEYSNDDSQLGQNVEDVAAEIETNSVDTRIEGSNKVTFAEWYNGGWGNLAIGGPNNKPAQLAINDDAEPELAQCDFWKECNDITADPNGSGGSIKQCGGLGSNTILSGFSWEEMYSVADLTTEVCEDPNFDTPVTLGDITPPFEARKAILEDYIPADSTSDEIAQALGYKLGPDYFPYGILFSPQNFDWVVTTKNDYLTQTDHYENTGGDIRAEECTEDGNTICADRAFESGDHIIYPPGPIGSGLNRLLEICVASNTSPICKYLNEIGYGGPVSMLFALPGASHGVDTDGNLDPTLTYNPTDGGKHIQLGYPLTEYCGCNQNAENCEDPSVTNFSNVNNPNGWVSDFVFEPIIGGLPNWQDTNTVRGADGASFFGRTIEKVANGIATIVSKFLLPGQLGGQCHDPTWGPTQATSCFNDPNGFECREVPCTEELGGVEATCYQSKNISQGYTCLGNVSVTSTVVNNIEEAGTERQNAKYLTTAFCLPGDESCIRPNTATLVNYDATHVASGEPGFGANIIPNEGAANSDVIRVAFAEPPVANEEEPPTSLEEDRGGGNSGTVPITGSAGCGIDGDLPDLAKFFPDGFPQPVNADKANYDAVNNLIKTQVVADGTGLTLAQVYAEASKQLKAKGLDVPCEALAGLHHLETGGKFSYGGVFNASLLSGIPITQPEANVSCPGCTFDSVLESAVVAGEWLYSQPSMGGTQVTDYKTLAFAFARYYGWSSQNLNCSVSGFLKHPLYSGTCPPDYPGEDAVYAMNWVDEKHRQMYEGASGGILQRAGAIAVAVMFYMSN